MLTIFVALGAAFAFVVGRNDGGPLVALSLQGTERAPLWSVGVLVLALLSAPVLGLTGVADTLFSMIGTGSSTSNSAAWIVASTLITLALATAVHIPTSITLALVGALTGAALAQGTPIDRGLLIRVIVLGLAAPVLAALCAWTLSRLPTWRRFPRPVARQLTFLALAGAYAVNDGQKLLFTALLLRHTIGTPPPGLVPAAFVAGVCLFALGALTSLRSASQFMRHGITSVSAQTVLTAELSAAAAVVTGAALGVPLSMTQSLVGALLGTGLSRSLRAVYWSSLQRIGGAWLWTMPFAIASSFLTVTLFGK